jgi:hypothetical protein
VEHVQEIIYPDALKEPPKPPSFSQRTQNFIKEIYSQPWRDFRLGTRQDWDRLQYRILRNSLVVTYDGEIVNIRTGETFGFVPFNEPRLIEDPNMKGWGKRIWDGVSAEKPGDTPKVIALGWDDLRLLKELRGGNLGYSLQTHEELRELNRDFLSKSISLRMIRLWDDPNSVFNTLEYRRQLSERWIRLWQEPEFKEKMRRRDERNTLLLLERWQDPEFKAIMSIANHHGQLKRYTIPGEDGRTGEVGIRMETPQENVPDAFQY